MFQTKVVEEIKTHIFDIFVFENRPVCEMTWKTFKAGQATDDNMAHVHCVLDA